MPTTTGYSFGDIVLVPFPFTDQTTAKKRPAIVVSSDAYHSDRRDMIVVAVTSQAGPASRFGECVVEDWKEAGLLRPSVAKPIVATIERDLVLRRLGVLGSDDRGAIRRALTAIFGR